MEHTPAFNEWMKEDYDLRLCRICGKPVWDGHYVEDEGYYHEDCVNEVYTDEQLREMYENDEQYYSEWWSDGSEECWDEMTEEEQEWLIKREKGMV